VIEVSCGFWLWQRLNNFKDKYVLDSLHNNIAGSEADEARLKLSLQQLWGNPAST
jgi:hypothetical protein